MTSHTVAALQALLVTFLWSTSFIVTKWIFAEGGVGPLWLMVLRYGSAAAVLLLYRRLFVPRAPQGSGPRDRKLWWKLAGLGILGYTINQGGAAVGLALLPASHVALILNVGNTLQVVLFAAVLLRERPSGIQLAGLGLGMLGSALFYYPLSAPPGGWWGAVPVLISGVGYALSTIYTRRFMKEGTVSALDLTVFAMAAGALAMAPAALAVEGLPSPAPRVLLYIGWLAVANTALCFTLWTHTQKVLAPFETAALNNTMLVQIAMLAWLVLGEPLGGLKLPAIALATLGTLLVQVGPRLQELRRAA